MKKFTIGHAIEFDYSDEKREGTIERHWVSKKGVETLSVALKGGGFKSFTVAKIVEPVTWTLADGWQTVTA